MPADVVAYEGGTVGTPGGTVSGHPSLSDGAVVQSAGWGIYTFWVPPRDDYLALSLTRSTSTGEVGVDSVTTEQDLMGSQDRFFAFADRILRELGWVA